MVCQNFEHSLDRYDELQNEERAVVEAHLLGCAACRDYRATLTEMDAWLTREYSSITPTPQFQQRVRSSVLAARETAPVSFLPEVFDFIGWSSLVIIALGVIWRTVDLQNLAVKIDAAMRLGGTSLVLPVAIGIALTAMALVGIGLKVYADLEP